MKKEFQMTNEELEAMKAISQSKEPVMKIGSYWSGMDKQDRANSFWKELGNKYGFAWDSVEGCPGKDITVFAATPLEVSKEVIPLEQPQDAAE